MATYHVETDKGTFEVETDEKDQPQSFADTLKASAQQALSPLAMLADKLQPKNVTAALPIGGAVLGTAILPGAGTAVGAGLGSIAKSGADMVYGTKPLVQPTTSVMGIPMAPKEAIWPMVDAATAGAPETTEGKAVIDAAGRVVDRAKPGIKKTLAAVGQMFTGKSKVKVGRIMEDPTAILPEALGGAKSVEDASKGYGEALDNTSVFHDEGYVTRGIEKKEFSPFGRGKGEADDVAQTVYDKWKAGEPISGKEAYDAKRATDYLWPEVVKERNAEKIRLMSEFKTAMDNVMSDASNGLPKMLKASKEYARARLKADFTQILPRTKTGDISTVKTLLMHTLAPGRTASLLFGGITSPVVTGAGNLAAQGAMKGLNVIGSNPASRVALAQALQKIMESKKKK